MSSETLTAIICAVFASTGFWTLINNIYLAKKKNKSAESRLMLGLAYDRIVALCTYYIDRGDITPEEYHDLQYYLYDPYKDMGGNGTAKKLMAHVESLPLKKED